MNITRAALEKNRITFTVVGLVLASGLMAYLSMPRSQDPGFIIRTALITTYFPGASPERVEKLVTDPLEKAIQEIPQLDTVTSTSKTGVSIIYVDIKESYKEMRPIWDSLRRKIEREAPSLPDETIGPFVNDEFGDVFGIIVSIIGDGFSYAEIKEVADQSRNELLLLDNVAKVEIAGAQEERIFLEYNNARLAQLGITPYQFQQLLASQNIVIPGGSLLVGEERIFLEPTGNFESVKDIEDTVITLPGSDVVHLRDLVSVSRGYIDPPDSGMYSSGTPALGLAISMRNGGNIIDLGNEVTETVQRLQAAYPIGIEFDIVAFEPGAVAVTIESFTSSLIQSVAVVMLVMVLFLGLRTGLVVASLIPSTILATFLVMSWFDIGLDKISLAALIISLGLLVDNAIVMSESCMTLIAEGMSTFEAAIRSAQELKIPLLTSSLTTAAAFLPIFLAESATGEYTASLFKVVTISLLSSWMMALTLIPLLCSRFLKVELDESGESYNSRFYRVYRKLLLVGLRLPALTILGIVVLFVLAIMAFGLVPKSFFPDSDQPMFMATLELPTGTAIEETDRIVREMDAFIGKELIAGEGREGITNWTSYVGEGAPRFYLSYGPEPPTPGLAFFLANVSNWKASERLIEQLREYAANNFPDAKLNGQSLPNGPLVKNPIEIRVLGLKSEKIFEYVADIKAKLAEIPGTLNVDDNWGFRTKKILVEVDQARARRASLTSRDIAISLQTVLSGLETTQFREDDKTIPIVLRSVAADRQDLGKLEQLSVYSQNTGQAVPLNQIADIQVVWEPPKIMRRNRLRTVTVSSKLVHGITPTEVEAQLVPWLEAYAKDWPPGYRFELGGENESSRESQASINEKLPIAGMIILLLLVGQFNSFRRPMIILATLPLGLIGVSAGFLITGAELGFMAFLGIISLFGIVINNAIVLIDRIGIEITEFGREPAQAIVEASTRRLRPILLTTVTTLAGLLPLWTGGGPMFEPMAITIIFGLAFATVLTLGLVPVLYSLFFRVSFKNYPS